MNPFLPQQPLVTQNMQDVSGQQPVFTNEAAQDQLHRALLQQNLGSPAGQQRSLGVNPLALAQMLREGGASGITERATGIGYDANGQNPQFYTPKAPDYSQPTGNLISTRD